MTSETIGACEKHQLPLDVHGECQLCRLSEMPSQAPPSRGGRWIVMTLIALGAGAVTWGVASFEPDEALAPTRGVPSSGAGVVTPTVQVEARQVEAREVVAPTPDTAPTPPPVDEGAGGAPTETEEADVTANQAQEWAKARGEVQVVMYATISCDICRQAREYMQDNGIAFTEHDIERDEVANRRIRELNPERTTPTFEIDDMVFVGFSADDFEAARTQAARKHLSEDPN